MIKFGSPEYKQKKNAALSLLGENRLQEANELYNSLCNKKNRSADDWYTLGAINGKLGDYTACIANSRKAVKYNPQHAPAWYCLGMAYQAKGEVDKALENICNAIGTNPDNKEYTDRFRRIRYELDQNRTLNVRIELGLEICVPASLECFTTYALLEQEDWFEHDIDFVRELLQPGDTVLDIGANYGVYTSTMASLVGDSGTVYAFEPASETAGLLRKTLANNTLDNVVVKQMALSSFTGTANLSNNFYSEMNSLSASPDSTGSEAVEVTTLDKVISETGIRDISFIKMDAEGEEANIIKGGENLFAGQSPLVMVEFRHNDELNLDLLEAFNRLGYSYYRFSPSPGILIPCDPEKDIASILLNIFCCKASAAKLTQPPAWRQETCWLQRTTVRRAADPCLTPVTGNILPTGWIMQITSPHCGQRSTARHYPQQIDTWKGWPATQNRATPDCRRRQDIIFCSRQTAWQVSQ